MMITSQANAYTADTHTYDGWDAIDRNKYTLRIILF